jgi:hypothetical protein
VATPAGFYTIRIKGRLGATALSAFSSMAHELKSSETVLTGWLEDRSALFGVLAQIEGLGLELLEVRQVRRSPQSRESGDDRYTRGNHAAEAETNADG